MQRCCDTVFAPRKITTDQYSLLRIVERRDGIRQNELAVELFTDPNTVTAMLVRMEKRRLIRREICSEDGRARRVSLTPAGRRLFARLTEDWAPMRRKLQEIFAGEGGQEAFRILEEVRALMSAAREEVIENRRKSPLPKRTAARPEPAPAMQAAL